MLIIGITGTLGAGKGTITRYLAEHYNFREFSSRAFLIEEIERRGDLPINRESMILVGNELRAQHGPGYVAEQLYDRATRSGGNCVIESLRTIGEIETLRSKPGQFYLFAVDANSLLRYERIKLRKSSTDRIDFEKFLSEEHREMASTDPSKQNLRACINAADYTFDNSKDLAHLYKQVNEVMAKLLD